MPFQRFLESQYRPLEKHLPILLKKYYPPIDYIQKINEIMIRGISTNIDNPTFHNLREGKPSNNYKALARVTNFVQHIVSKLDRSKERSHIF